MRPVGLDISEPTIRRLRKEFPNLEWVVGDVREMAFANNSFDTLLSWGVIEHIEEGPQRALSEFHRVLRRNGHVFITVPWLNSFRLRSGGYSQNGDNYSLFAGSDNVVFHQYYMTENEIQDFVRKAGFKILKTCPSAVHAKSLLSLPFKQKFSLITRIFNRVFSSLLPSSLVAHMIMVVGRKWDSGS
jgi:ubiquinone/menaquinone biosynthesis C-methylase UbiE